MTDIKRFTFRLPIDLYNRMEKIAEINHRSVTAQIIVAIEEFLKENETPKTSIDNNNN